MMLDRTRGFEGAPPPPRHPDRPHTDFPIDVARGIQSRWVYRDGTRSSYEPALRYFRLVSSRWVRAYWPPAACGIETRPNPVARVRGQKGTKKGLFGRLFRSKARR